MAQQLSLIHIFEEIPAEEMEKATELHKALVEAAAEHDEGLMEKLDVYKRQVEGMLAVVDDELYGKSV